VIYPIYAETCTEAWLKTATKLLTFKGRAAYNVILDINDPVALTAADKTVVQKLDGFLLKHNTDPVSTVAGTIFPAAHYKRQGATGVYKTFPEIVYPKVRSGWGDTYAGRMLRRSGKKGVVINPLGILVEKLKKQLTRRSPLGRAYELGFTETPLELPIYDVALDATRTTPQPCLSHVSFKVVNGEALMLTALYRSHYYIQRALGNLIGLAQLQYFVANEVGLNVGELVCHSSYACVEAGDKWKTTEAKELVSDCNALVANVEESVTEVG
jgi:hypothetical protein